MSNEERLAPGNNVAYFLHQNQIHSLIVIQTMNRR